ncbi:ferric reductase transmembrane component 4 [Cryptococcus wingfieldii CBS 7118]|uniref:ferric-chelate reductase (NADPH) n=1 Tax=Cryptococcus wingfieldii CBS 7118 TaxID=1295528 RepID=A0A1E3HYA9_9TREE|nr:ferric reductase transmembrane component 4 [Cryptococcus wingfieldii CBS 7118]ODN81314.1 ferric reductase transmembrane component 4 [Cryptococcus wingfieldii CBS 7118]
MGEDQIVLAPSSTGSITLSSLLSHPTPHSPSLNHTLPSIPFNATEGHNATPTPPPYVKPPKYHYFASRYSWIWISSTILILIIIHLIRTRRHKRRLKQSLDRRRRQWKSARVSERDFALEELEQSKGGWVGRRVRALGAGWRNVMYMRGFPVWLYMPETVADAGFTVLYTVVYLFFCLHRTTSWFPVRGYENAANQLGVMSFSQLPIILLLVSKNNPIASLTGITYQKLNYLHRASSRVCLLTSWGHALLWTPDVWEIGDTRPYLLWGIAALTGFTMLWLTSFRFIRRMAWEFFIVSHILFSLLYLIGAYFHWNRLSYWVWPAILIWAFDRCLRFIKVSYINKISPFIQSRRDAKKGKRSNRGPQRGVKVELLEHDVMRVTIEREGWSWKAGQHAFISAPSLTSSPHESHPFSIANIPTSTSNAASFLIRVHSGFTKRLMHALHSDVEEGLPLLIEGPYGYPHSLDSYSTVVLLAGGTGVTFTSSHFLQILQNAASGRSAIKHLHLVWHIRHASHIQWIAPLLNLAAEYATKAEQACAGVDWLVDIYVTKSPSADEPWRPNTIAEPERGGGGLESHSISHSRSQSRSHSRSHSPAPSYRPDELLTPKAQQVRIPLLSDEQDGYEGAQDREEEEDAGWGLTMKAWSYVRWNKGRADLREIVEEDAREAEGAMNVSVCGPVQLLQASKKAVREVSTMQSTREGLMSIDFFEETLGA